jgi:HAD superfamily hydrolase (TIGR01549 family)
MNQFLTSSETHATCLLFDLDGTLLDSFAVHFGAYAVMFAHYGIQVSEETFLATYSPDWYQTYDLMGLPREVWEQANQIWLEEAAKRIPDLYPGVREALTCLSADYPLGIVTSGSRSRVWRDLEANGLHQLFKTVITGDDVLQPKPSPDGLEMALENIGAEPSQAIYIGDTLTDYETARTAGVVFIGVRSRFGGLQDQHGCCLLSSVVDLPDLLHNIRL